MLFLVLSTLVAVGLAANPLESLGADGTQVSVSGLSAGACFATQYHVAYSAEVMGMGFVAGAPYWCAQGNLMTALGACMSSPSGINVNTLVSHTNGESNIDSPANMQGDRIWLFGGTNDNTVKQGSVQKTEEYYRSFVSSSDIFSKYDMNAGHAFPTENYGNPCSTATQSPWISSCNYHAAYEMLNHIYGGLVRPSSGSNVASQGEFKTFDQTEFTGGSPGFTLPFGKKKRNLMQSWLDMMSAGVDMYWDAVGAMTDFWTGAWGLPDFSLPGTDTDGSTGGSTGGTSSGSGGYSMDSEGYIFIPSGCKDQGSNCKLHVSFHGCKQGKNAVGDTYARHTGFLEVAELNNIIVLFPQAVPDAMKMNPNGCFDWWGYEDSNYANKNGHQMSAVHAMVQRLLQ